MQNRILKSLWVCVATLAFTGCAERELGPVLTEKGEIYDTCFTPANHGMTSGRVGITTNGDVSVHFPEAVEIPAVYAVVFKCEHGKFAIDGQRGEALYKQLSKGDHVLIKYQEVFLVEHGQRKLVELHFVNALKDTEGDGAK